MIDLTPSEEQLLLAKTARDFAARAVTPAVDEAERTGDGHLDLATYLGIHRQAAEIGIMAMALPPEHGGGGHACTDVALVAEELGAADVAIGSALTLSMTVPHLIVAAGTDEQRARWLPAIAAADDYVLSGALNEPGVAGSELMAPLPDPSLGLRTTARRDGDDWVINGAKAAWVTNGGVAKAYFVFARTATDQPAATSTSCFFVPADTPGVSGGSRGRFLGMRAGFHGEVLLDDVRVPASSMIGPEGQGLQVMGMGSGAMVVALAAGFVGLARRAYELTRAWVDERTSWGVPIRQHQAVSLALADMAVDLRTARLMVWDAAAAVDRGDVAALATQLPAAKTHAVDVAIANAERAVRLHGATGVASGAGPEKLLRDAWTGYSCDFTREILRLGLSAAL